MDQQISNVHKTRVKQPELELFGILQLKTSNKQKRMKKSVKIDRLSQTF